MLVRGVERREVKSVGVGDGVGGAGFHAISAENAAVVVNVVNLGVTLGPTYPVLGGVFSGLNVDAVGRAVGRPQEAGHTLFQSVLSPPHPMYAPQPLPYLYPPHPPRALSHI